MLSISKQNNNLEIKNQKIIAIEYLILNKFMKSNFKWPHGADDHLATKNKLFQWLNDHHTGRKGIISLYQKDYPEHFNENQNWQAVFLVPLVEFCVEKLLDKEFVKKSVDDFYISIRNKKWFNAMTLELGYKMLLKLYKKSELNSNYARDAIGFNERMKQEKKELYKLSGKRKDDAFEEKYNQKIEKVLAYFSNQSFCYKDERKLYKVYKNQAINQLNNVRKKQLTVHTV